MFKWNNKLQGRREIINKIIKGIKLKGYETKPKLNKVKQN